MAERRGRGRPPHPDVLTPAECQVLNWEDGEGNTLALTSRVQPASDR